VVVELPDQNCHHDLAVLQVISEHIDHQNLGKVRRWCLKKIAAETESLPTPARLQKRQPSATATRLAAVATAALEDSSAAVVLEDRSAAAALGGSSSLHRPARLQKRQPSATATRLAAVATAALGGSSTLDNDDSDDSHATGHFERDVHDTFHAEKMHRDT